MQSLYPQQSLPSAFLTCWSFSLWIRFVNMTFPSLFFFHVLYQLCMLFTRFSSLIIVNGPLRRHWLAVASPMVDGAWGYVNHSTWPTTAVEAKMAAWGKKESVRLRYSGKIKLTYFPIFGLGEIQQAISKNERTYIDLN